MNVSPYEIAEYYLDVIINFDFTDPANAEGHLSAEQVADLKSAGLVTNQMIVSVNKMLKELSGSDDLENIKWTANLKNRMILNIQPVIVDEIDQGLDDGAHITWTPSFAKEIDPLHAINYGRTMTWGTAKKKGLGTRYGCKCGFDIVNQKNEKAVEEQLTLEGVNLIGATN